MAPNRTSTGTCAPTKRTPSANAPTKRQSAPSPICARAEVTEIVVPPLSAVPRRGVLNRWKGKFYCETAIGLLDPWEKGIAVCLVVGTITMMIYWSLYFVRALIW